MEQVRIAILSAYDKVCAFMDNEAPKALHYYEDEFFQYLKGSASTFSCKASARHEDSEYLVEGNKLAFRYRDKDYYLNIMSVVRDEWEVEIEAYSLNFELLNEEKEAYKAPRAMKFTEYLDVFDYENVVTLGINEVSEKSLKHEWTGASTMLARIFSLATVFGAEAEFVPQLNEDFSLKRVVLNVYRAYSDSGQGIGSNRTDTTLRYGKNVSGITKTSDILDLCTAIRPFGRDGLTVTSLDKKEYDANGKLEYHSPAGNRNIHAVQARDRFPSNLMGKENDRYIAKIWEYDTDNVNTLYGQALAELKKLCVPQVSYQVEGSFDVDIGDTVMIADEEYKPELYLRARVTEQRVSFTEPKRNQTTFDNFKELQSEIDQSLLAQMKKLINENKTYTCTISTDNGIVFKNGMGDTTLTASVMDVGKDITDYFSINWSRDGLLFHNGKSTYVEAASVKEKAVYKFEAYDGSTLVGMYEVTVSNVDDGTGRIYVLESSDETIRRALDGTLSRESIDFYAFYRVGDSVENREFYGKFIIDQTVDGKTWDIVYSSATPESTVKYYLKWLLGNADGSAVGNEDGAALGVDFVDVVQLRCRLFSPDGKSLIGVRNVTILKDGDPTGVYLSKIEPEQKFDGMLWKNTGDTEGLYKGATYRWDNEKTKWDIYTFRAENIEAESFRGYLFEGSVFSNEFDFVDEEGDGGRVVGTSRIQDGYIDIDSTYVHELYTRYLSLLLKYDGIKIGVSGAGSGAARATLNAGGVSVGDAHGMAHMGLGGVSLGTLTAGDCFLTSESLTFSFGADSLELSRATVGNLDDLKTRNKTIVGAINEIYDKMNK